MFTPASTNKIIEIVFNYVKRALHLLNVDTNANYERNISVS